MSFTVNKVILIGRVGDKVKIHYFEGGNCIGRFPLATDESYLNRTTNERIIHTEWHNIVLKNKQAEFAERTLEKGDKIYIEGRIKTRQWKSEDGTMKSTTEIIALDMVALRPKKNKNLSFNQEEEDEY